MRQQRNSAYDFVVAEQRRLSSNSGACYHCYSIRGAMLFAHSPVDVLTVTSRGETPLIASHSIGNSDGTHQSFVGQIGGGVEVVRVVSARLAMRHCSKRMEMKWKVQYKINSSFSEKCD